MNRRELLISGAAFAGTILFGRAHAALKTKTSLTAYISHDSCLKHNMGAQHPEQPARLLAIENALENAGLLKQMQHFEAPKATHSTARARAHTTRLY